MHIKRITYLNDVDSLSPWQPTGLYGIHLWSYYFQATDSACWFLVKMLSKTYKMICEFFFMILQVLEKLELSTEDLYEDAGVGPTFAPLGLSYFLPSVSSFLRIVAALVSYGILWYTRPFFTGWRGVLTKKYFDVYLQ